MDNGTLSGVLTLDAGLRVKAATFAVGDFLGGLDPVRCLLTPDMRLAPHHTRSCSRCLTVETRSERHTLLVNYRWDGEDLVLRFDPLKWIASFCESTAGYVCIADHDHTVVYGNAALARRSQRTEVPILGSRVRDLCAAFGVDPTVIDHMTERALDGEPLTHEFRSTSGRDLRTTSCAPLRYHERICATIWAAREAPQCENDGVWTPRQPSGVSHTREWAILVRRLHDAVALSRAQGVTGEVLAAMTEDVHLLAELVGISVDAAVDPYGFGNLSVAAEIAIATVAVDPETRLLTFNHRAPSAEPTPRCNVMDVARAFREIFRDVAHRHHDAHVVISYAWSDSTLHCIVEDGGPPGAANAAPAFRRHPPPDGAISVLRRHGGSWETAPTVRGTRLVVRLPLSRPPGATSHRGG